ncbi:calcium-activated chloride channel regulator 1-like isoform X3 [Erpetoichthys calabaricus]|uniref:calcium-activated chloride channel regulator 1-like isoform X3 n=1 Tax=Erpetoichthys calabaricus TaxID=27687 RepID=UPI0022347E26|nr:calcium-activated chloride channel regulator 1-like isoform X3 [Erpetoichthys calabaricus]
MGTNNYLVVFSLFLLLPHLTSSKIELVDKGYRNLVIAIHKAVPENPQLIEKIKEMLKEASNYLYVATKFRVFFKDVKILLPDTWTTKPDLYRKATTETYSRANVIIAGQKNSKGDEPYTLQYEGCGKEGRYIHFTPNFLLNDKFIQAYGPRGKVFVHEWAHLRWGVFNEYNEYQPFYREGDHYRVTKCPKDLSGKVCFGNDCSKCNLENANDPPKEGCVFLPEKYQETSSSIMYTPVVKSVNQFCNKSNHNQDAPNDQNKFCKLKSAWEIILESEDFRNANEATDSGSVEPQFTVMQESQTILCLVLDVSGSMSGSQRLERLQQSSTLFIEKIAKEESFIGIVTFNNIAYVKKGLTYVSGDDVRKILVNALPTKAEGGTNICSGIRDAFEVLSEDDGSTEGDEILLLTDGEDSGISSCFEAVKTSGTIVHTIALGPSAAKELEMLSEMTNGKKYYASDNFNSNGLLEAFMELSEEQIQLESTGGTQEPGDSLLGDTYIDSEVGFNTTFLVTWQTDVKPDIIISDPDGKEYLTKDFKLEDKATVGTLIIPGKAKTGKWSYRIENTAHQPQSMTISITSQPSGAQSEPVIVKTNLQQTNEPPYTVVIYVEVFKNFMPVRHANVTAIIETANTKIIPVILKDNGAAADLVKDDGIYSSFMTDYDGTGRYNFKVQVSKLHTETKAAAGHTSGAMYVQGYLENGTVHLNPPKPVVVDDEDFPVEDFVRTKSGGTFMVKVVPPANQDVFPPCQITDLSAELLNNTVILAWTAPGDDMDKGTVAEYEIRKSKQAVHLRDNFHNATQINTSSIIPLAAGSREQLLFDLEEEEKVNNSVIFFAVVSRDESLLSSDVSNIAQVVIYHPSPKSRDPDTSNQNRKLTVGLAVSLVTIILCSVLGLIALIINKRNSGMMVLDEEHVRKKLNIVAEA